MITRITRTITTSQGPKPIRPTSYAYVVSRSIGFRGSAVKSLTVSDLDHQFDFNREAGWQLVDTDGCARVSSGVAEDIDEEIRCAVRDGRLLIEPVRAVDERA